MCTLKLQLPELTGSWTLTTILLSVCLMVCRQAVGPLKAIPGPWHTRFTNLVLKYKVLTGQRSFYIHQLHQKYGPVVRIEPREVNVCDLDWFAEIHRIGSGFVKADWYDRATFGIDHNVFVMTNVREHAARRKLLARPFARSSLLTHFNDLVSDRARTAVARIKQGAATGPCDVYKWWTLMAADFIHQVAFGEDSRLLEAGEKTQYVDDLERVIWLWALRGEAPVLYHAMRFAAPKQFRGLSESPHNVVAHGVSAATRAKKKSVPKSNIMSGMMEDSRVEGAILNEKALGAQASALIVAGSWTTAVTLTYATWAIFFLKSFSHRRMGEVTKLERYYDDAALERLPYLKAVVMEVLRLYGAAPGSLPRVLPTQSSSMNGNYIPAAVL